MKHHPDTSSESRIRLTAFFVLVLTPLYLFTGLGFVAIFLLLDFGLRAFNLGAYSPLGNLSGLFVRALHLPRKPVYMPPKRFAARIGFVFFLAIVLLHFITHPASGPAGAAAGFIDATPLPTDNDLPLVSLASTILASVIILFAALESLMNFCAGCYVYNLLVRLRHR